MLHNTQIDFKSFEQIFGSKIMLLYIWSLFVQSSKQNYCQAHPQPQPANPQLGAEIALLSQLWGTTLHPTTPCTRNSSFACLEHSYYECGDFFITH